MVAAINWHSFQAACRSFERNIPNEPTKGAKAWHLSSTVSDLNGCLYVLDTRCQISYPKVNINSKLYFDYFESVIHGPYKAHKSACIAGTGCQSFVPFWLLSRDRASSSKFEVRRHSVSGCHTRYTQIIFIIRLQLTAYYEPASLFRRRCAMSAMRLT